ncbi:MAG: PepSY-associated TM helix domain-containing protein [Rhodospirillaceae bacterium]|nr:PepSY-associated TM helix domain-containing protein [Rhodospirillaceae bacterium]
MVTKFRAGWLLFHRWVGIVLGIVIAVLGVSGSLLVFDTEIDAALNPHLLRVQPAGTPRSFDAIVQAAADAHPGWTPRYLQRGSDDPTASVMVLLRDGAQAEKQVFVNPYTLAVLGERSGMSAIALVRHIHGELLMGEAVGGTIVGVLSFLCAAFFIAGAVLWWPAKGGVKRALTIKIGSETPRLMRELHNVFGAGPAVLFILASITVPPLVWMGSTDGGGGGSGSGAGGPAREGAPPQAPAQAPPQTPPRMLTWDEAAAFAATEAPGQYVGLILRQEGPRGIYMVRFWPPGETGVSKQSNVIMPLAGGRIIRVQRPAPFSPASIYKTDFAANVHSGAILGLPGRLVMFAAGLFLPVLFVTGLAMWWMKRRRAV